MNYSRLYFRYPQRLGTLHEEYTESSSRPRKSEFRKFHPKFARELREVTVQNMVAGVKRIYKEVTGQK